MLAQAWDIYTAIEQTLNDDQVLLYVIGDTYVFAYISSFAFVVDLTLSAVSTM